MNRLIRFIHDYGPDLVLSLSAIAIFLIAPKLLEPLFISSSKGVTELTLKLIGTFLAVLASVASYRRFFRGRLFTPRLKLHLSSNAVCKLQDQSVVHGIDIEIENIGGITIWEPQIDLRVFELENNEWCTLGNPATEGLQIPTKRGGIEGIEPGESITYHYHCKIPDTHEVFRILVDVSMDERHAWHRAVTVSNSVAVSPDSAN